jgi:uncharacterized protein YbjQ (UPF0145 family)
MTTDLPFDPNAPPPMRQFFAELERSDPTPADSWTLVVVTTTQTVPGYETQEYRGLVTARVVVGHRGWKSLKMQLADTFGTRSATLEAEIQTMQRECVQELKKAAHQKGGNAVVGLSFQFGEASGEASLFYCLATGTAVVVGS